MNKGACEQVQMNKGASEQVLMNKGASEQVQKSENKPDFCACLSTGTLPFWNTTRFPTSRAQPCALCRRLSLREKDTDIY